MVHAQPPNLYLYNHQPLGKCKPYQQLKFFKIDTKSTKKNYGQYFDQLQQHEHIKEGSLCQGLT